MKMQYLLDTDILILMMRGLKIQVPKTDSQRKIAVQARHILSHCRQYTQEGHDICCSATTVAELEFGARKSLRYEQEKSVTRQVLSAFQLLDWMVADCPTFYGEIRHQLEAQGKIIGENDLLIAAHALALGAVLVTNNIREFNRISGLKVENWTQLR